MWEKYYVKHYKDADETWIDEDNVEFATDLFMHEFGWADKIKERTFEIKIYKAELEEVEDEDELTEIIKEKIECLKKQKKK